MTSRKRFPVASNPKKVGSYPAAVSSGGGYVWDEVLEYRVWCHPEHGALDLDSGSDYFFAFATYPKALAFSKRTAGAEEPLVLILQKQHIDEPKPGVYVHSKKRRMTEWRVAWLSRPRRTPDTIRDFLSPTAPANRVEILRGEAKPKRRMSGHKKVDSKRQHRGKGHER